MSTKAKIKGAKNKGKRPPVTKQREATEIPGFESDDPYNRKLSDCAKNYVDVRDTRIAASKDEHEAHQTLLDAMKEAGVSRYAHGELIVMLTGKEKVSVKLKKKPPDANGDG